VPSSSRPGTEWAKLQRMADRTIFVQRLKETHQILFIVTQINILMKFKFLAWVVFGLLLMGSNCGTEDADDLIRCDLKNHIKTVSGVSGTIWFDSQTQAYAIFRGIEGTYDAQDI
jgi:hypothetical protein